MRFLNAGFNITIMLLTFQRLGLEQKIEYSWAWTKSKEKLAVRFRTANKRDEKFVRFKGTGG